MSEEEKDKELQERDCLTEEQLEKLFQELKDCLIAEGMTPEEADERLKSGQQRSDLTEEENLTLSVRIKEELIKEGMTEDKASEAIRLIF